MYKNLLIEKLKEKQWDVPVKIKLRDGSDAIIEKVYWDKQLSQVNIKISRNGATLDVDEFTDFLYEKKILPFLQKGGYLLKEKDQEFDLISIKDAIANGILSFLSKNTTDIDV